MADRTKIPGIDSNDSTRTNLEHQKTTNLGFSEIPVTGTYNDSYSMGKGTVVPGMGDKEEIKPSRHISAIGKPIVGFLVSVSRLEEGEYWVLRQGQNTIGSGSNCNIVLQEASVSGIHALLAVHRNPNNENRLNVGLIDRGSSNGTLVNENYIGFETHQCQNGDKIRIGNYELVLLLFDVAEYKLAKEKNFIPKDDSDYSNRDFYNSTTPRGTDRTML